MDNAVQDITRHVTEHGIWLKDFFVFLAAAALVVPLFQRARIGAVAGFLLVGRRGRALWAWAGSPASHEVLRLAHHRGPRARRAFRRTRRDVSSVSDRA